MNSTALVPTLPTPPNGHAAGGTLVIDLSRHPDALDRLYKEALRRGIPLGHLVEEMFLADVQRLTPPSNPPAADPDGRAAYASGRGLEVPAPEGKN